MINNKNIAVVIPAYNEEEQIISVITNIPNFVDKVIIVNDGSTDATLEIVKKYINKYQKKNILKLHNKTQNNRKYDKANQILEKINSQENKLFPKFKIITQKPKDKRYILISLEQNNGVGAAISIGYKWCRDHDIDCTAVMDGDGQMDPEELKKICEPVVNTNIDYVKGNRLSHRSALLVIPKIRYIGNSVLSLLTKIASGYWRISDTQTGFRAISLNALKAIRIHQIYPRYGYPNDMLVKLNIAFCSIKEIPIKPVYEIGETSKMKIFKVIPKISWLLIKGFFKRLYVKYLFRDFHPLFLLYHFAFFLLLADIPFIIQSIQSLHPDITLPMQSLIIVTFLSISGFQSLFFAMWMDMMDNERLHVS